MLHRSLPPEYLKQGEVKVKVMGTFFNEDRESKISSLERGVVILSREQEIFGLEIAVQDSHEVANVNNVDNGAAERSGGSLGVVTLGDDPVEELPAGAEFHYKVDRHPVLVRPLELHNVVLPRQMLHDLNLPLHVLPVRLRHQLPLENRLARVRRSGGILRAQIRYPELPSSQFPPQSVVLLYILKGFP